MSKSWIKIGISVLVLALVGAACSSGDSSNSGTSSNSSKNGADGNDVLAVQRELTSLGCAPGPLDGTLGADTKAAIKNFQAANGLSADGIIGPNTRAALAFSAQTGSVRCPVTPTSSPPTTKGGGSSTTPPCTDAALRPAVIASLSSGEQLFKLNAFKCASNWAVTNPTVGIPSNEIDVTVLLRWNGSAWQAVDRGVYCNNGSVPASIYQDACTTN